MDPLNLKSSREKLFIDPKFQTYFLTYTIGIAVVICSVFFLAGRYFYWEFLKQGEALKLPPQHAFFRFIEAQQHTLELVLLMASVFVILFLLSYGLYVSNRIAGPIHRLKVHLDEYRAGKHYEEIFIREKDFFPELAQSLNASIKHAENSSGQR